MPNTTWNNADKSALVVLSGGDLIATVSSGSDAGVRGAHSQSAGKFYFELTPTSWNFSTNVGIATSAASFTANSTGTCIIVRNSGSIYVNNVNTTMGLGARANNNIIGIAIDLDARLAWFRVSPAGLWNGNASANPATGAVGANLAPLGGGVSLFPYTYLQSFVQSVTANFGNAAFSGAVPSGFTAGFPDGPAVVPSTQGPRVMVMA